MMSYYKKQYPNRRAKNPLVYRLAKFLTYAIISDSAEECSWFSTKCSTEHTSISLHSSGMQRIRKRKRILPQTTSENVLNTCHVNTGTSKSCKYFKTIPH